MTGDKINLRPHSATPLEIGPEEYDRLIRRTQGGWSHCADETEWLAKLRYLRQGLKEGRLEPAQFQEREARLVVGWLSKGL